jgi:AbrB family looped-hinge helix DNA binding protein
MATPQAALDYSAMTTVVVSSKGQIVLPAALRRRLGLGAGARLEVAEEPDGLRLRVTRECRVTDLSDLGGMVKAPSCGKPRRLDDFDPASLSGPGRGRSP